ncbi:unnamed protein product [Lupinus luteus]|uniref:K+ potassium transporter integral membrane domain-containing protein n=1 Tax=Lupinus luteus TaxID=3873 RepID=A0AAV1XUT3_LUPLU
MDHSEQVRYSNNRNNFNFGYNIFIPKPNTKKRIKYFGVLWKQLVLNSNNSSSSFKYFQYKGILITLAMFLTNSMSPPRGPHSSNDVVVLVNHNAPHPPTSLPNPQSPQKEREGKKETLILAYRTLGVVFGGLVTSPLYVYPSMNLKSPTEADFLGIYSIIFWTLTLIGLVKYANIAIKADDNGEGGTFALYSLLCRHLNIGILPSRQVNISSSIDSIPYSDVETHGWLAKFFKRSLIARRLLLFIAMLGTCMLIGDGILTPAISGTPRRNFPLNNNLVISVI